MEIQRRTFLATVGAGALATSPEARSSEAAPSGPAGVTGGQWDLSWTDRVDRKHRAVFDSPGFNGGAALFRAVAWKREYQEVYGTSPADMKAVLVLRHDGIWLAMDDVFWKTYDVGAARSFKGEAPGKFLAANPVARPAPDAPPGFADVSAPNFLAGGDVILACHLAFGAVAALVRKVDKLASDDEAEKKARAFLLPGVILQPSGVFAALRAQEAGCSYILAS